MATKRKKKGRPAREWSAKAPVIMIKHLPYHEGRERDLSLLHYAPLGALELNQGTEQYFEIVKARLMVGVTFSERVAEKEEVLSVIKTANTMLDNAYRSWQVHGTVPVSNLIPVREAFVLIDDMEKLYDRLEVYQAHLEARDAVLKQDGGKQVARLNMKSL